MGSGELDVADVLIITHGLTTLLRECHRRHHEMGPSAEWDGPDGRRWKVTFPGAKVD